MAGDYVGINTGWERGIKAVKRMKVVGINGSATKDGNTAILIRRVFEELE